MSVVLRPTTMKVRNEGEEFQGFNVVADEKTSEKIEAIEKKGDDVLASLPGEYTEIYQAFNSLKENVDLLNGFSLFSNNISWIDGEYIDKNDGSVKTLSSYHRTDYIPLDQTNYTLILTSENAQTYDRNYNAWYDSDKNFISNFSYLKDDSMILSTPLNAAFFRLSSNKTVKLSLSANYQSSIKKSDDVLVKSLLSFLQDNLISFNIFTKFKQGYYKSTTGVYEPDHSNYVCTVEPGKCSVNDIIDLSSLQSLNATNIYLVFFNDNMEFIKAVQIYAPLLHYRISDDDLESVAYFHIDINIDPSISPSNIPTFITYNNAYCCFIDYIKRSLISNNVYMLPWHNYIYYYGIGNIQQTRTRIGIISPIVARSNIKVSVSDSYKYAIFKFSSTTPSTDSEVLSTGWITDDYIIEPGDIFLINLSKSDDSNIAPEEGINVTFTPFIKPLDKSSDYVITQDFLKKPVFIEQLGRLKYAQSFCVYNNKFYSVSGQNNIAEQDAEFNVLRDTTLNVGHGNALQLGSSNIAYASGWSDNNIYAVDLDTLTIVDTISLPTTGYTTCVVDDLNHLAYIFQRDSYPDTVTNYKFMVYDYDNDEIKLTRTINSFGGMQAADYYNGKIIIAWGLGGTAVPNGMAVYNTAGDMLAEYVLDTFKGVEPEGVCFLRDGHKLIMSNIDRFVYELYTE